MSEIFSQIGLLIIAATALALLVRIFKQPPLLGYILTGLLLGPLGTKMISSPEVLEGMRQIGVALLLFLVGMELDWTKARRQLKTVSILGISQILLSFLAGFALALIFDQSVLTGVYLGLALAFSSTVIVVKILSESRDLNSLPGRLSLGLLLVQDGAAVLALTLLTGIGHNSGVPLGLELTYLAGKTIAVLFLVWICTEYLLPQLFRKIAKHGELLFLSSLAWCFIFSLSLYSLNFPIEIGALLAGISLAPLPYSIDMINRLRSIRDFFVILLFVAMGSSIEQPSIEYLPLTIGLILLTIIGKPLISYIILIMRGYTSRTAFITGLTQSQLSEFSLLLVTMGLSKGVFNTQVATAITITAIVSIFISTIVLTARASLYKYLRPFLQVTERKHHDAKDTEISTRKDHIVIFGYHRMGYHILKKLRSLNHQVLIIDFNPDIVHKLTEQGIDCLYGDVQDEELIEASDAKDATMVISTIPHREETTFLLNDLRKRNKNNIIIVTAHNIDDALEYYKDGASYVILPHILGGEHVADLITKYEKGDLSDLIRNRQEEIKLLKTKNHALYYD